MWINIILAVSTASIFFRIALRRKAQLRKERGDAYDYWGKGGS